MVNERFIELLAKKLSDDIHTDELEEFKYFLTHDENCRRQYIFFKAYWVPDQEQYSNTDFMFQRIKNKIDIQEQQTETDIENEQSPKASFTFWRWIAAILLIGICLPLSYYLWHRDTKVAQPMANLELTKTPSRVKSKLVLSDGSVITLNSETTLKYPLVFSGPTREVFLNGEAFFDVAKDHNHPFIVHAGKMNIKVLGTAFNVKSYTNDPSSETTLIRGAIEVTLADRPSDRIILKPRDKLILKSTTFKKYSSPDNHITAIAHDSVNTNYALTNLTYLKSNDTTIVETSWVNNRLVFKDEDFNVLANKMERWYGIKIKFKNNGVKDYHFTGIFEKETITQALYALQIIEPFNYKMKDEIIYIY